METLVPRCQSQSPTCDQQAHQQELSQQVQQQSPVTVICDGQTLNQYSFFNRSKLGCTRLVRGHVVGCQKHAQLVTGKAITSKQLPSFLQHEGAVHAVLRRHPHVALPKLLNTLEPVDGSGYIVLSNVGDDLHTYVRTKKRLCESEARGLFRQLAHAVSHCHDHRIVLRDMKLGKIFFTDNKRTNLVLGDIDGAQVLPSHGSPLLRNQKGSPAYVSPEVLSGLPYDGAAADVWGLGVILFVLLTGRYPFQDNRPASLFRKIQQASDAVSFPSFLSGRAVRLVKALLSKNPATRPTAAEIKAHPWLSEPEVFTTACVVDNDPCSIDDQVVPEITDRPSPKRKRESAPFRVIPDEPEYELPRTTSSSSSPLTMANEYSLTPQDPLIAQAHPPIDNTEDAQLPSPKHHRRRNSLVASYQVAL